MPKLSKGMQLPATDHVVRHVPWTRLRKDEEDNVLGLLPEAFQLRPEELGLSVNWLEYYPGNRGDQIKAVAKDIRSGRGIGPKSGFAIGNVGTLCTSCKDYGAPLKVVFSPTKRLLSHSLIKNLRDDDLALLSLIAEDVFVEFIQSKNILN
jgi:hypothetical protein